MESNGSNSCPSPSNKRIYKVVLTGGPCGGKTTGQSRLCTFFENLGWKVYRVPETATILLSGGVKFAELSQDEALKFQENLLLTMLQLEKVYFDLAQGCRRNCLIICDRGTMDASAFIAPEAWDGILARNNFNPVELRDNRYNQIIHMVSAAVGAEAFYSTEDHVVRSENLEGACELDRKAAQAWIGHPYFDVIDNTSDFDTKIKRMITMVCQKIGVETGDRLKNNARKIKYLVRGPLPPVTEFPKFQDFTVEHVYLRTNSRKMQARIRKRGVDGNHSYTYTIRKPEQLGQIVEVRTQVTQRDWNTAKGQADDQHFHIYKTRRCFLHNDQYFQLDIYREPCHRRCNGLMLLETYSTLTGDEMTLRLPDFLDIQKEVTGNPEYSMYNLSLRDEWCNTTKFCVNIAAGKVRRSSLSRTTGNKIGDEGLETGRRVSECDSDYWDGGDGAADTSRLSECDADWNTWHRKVINNSNSTLDEDDEVAGDSEDDEFYENMDKQYNGNRKSRDETSSNGVHGGGDETTADDRNAFKQTDAAKCKVNGVGGI